MKQSRFLSSIAIFVLLALLLTISTAFAGQNRNFRAHLQGRNEIPAVDSNGQGQAIFQLNKAETALAYKLIVANIDNVTQAHIHCGPVDANGPVVAFLFGFVDGGVTVNGVLSEGTITEANVISRPDSEACPGGVSSFDDLLAQIRAGNAYVNVHTVAYPGGEIRGQIH